MVVIVGDIVTRLRHKKVVLFGYIINVCYDLMCRWPAEHLCTVGKLIKSCQCYTPGTERHDTLHTQGTDLVVNFWCLVSSYFVAILAYISLFLQTYLIQDLSVVYFYNLTNVLAMTCRFAA